MKAKLRKIQSRVRKRPNALARIMSQNNDSPLISNRRRSRLSEDHATSLELIDVVHDHAMRGPNSTFGENNGFMLTKDQILELFEPQNRLSNENNKKEFSK